MRKLFGCGFWGEEGLTPFQKSLSEEFSLSVGVETSRPPSVTGLS